MSLPLLPLTITGCGRVPPVEEAAACLSTEAEVDPYAPYGAGGQTLDVAATVVSDTAATGEELPGNVVFACWPAVSRVLELQDGDGLRWWVGYGVEGEEEEDLTPAIDLAAGADVQLRFRTVQGFGAASGFVVTDADGLVMALEVGTWGAALLPGDVPGLQVTVGEEVAKERVDCGTQQHTSLVFTGDDSIELEAGEDGALQIDGASYTAHTIRSYDWEEVTCTDIGGIRSWIVWR